MAFNQYRDGVRRHGGQSFPGRLRHAARPFSSNDDQPSRRTSGKPAGNRCRKRASAFPESEFHRLVFPQKILNTGGECRNGRKACFIVPARFRQCAARCFLICIKCDPHPDVPIVCDSGTRRLALLTPLNQRSVCIFVTNLMITMIQVITILQETHPNTARLF